ncbi:MAG: heavy metal-binding domain-containing protein, partial [Thermoplasmatota archaeon]
MTTYTCPMDPDIRHEGPGACPRCGMALEPLEIRADAPEDDGEFRAMRRRLWVSAVLSAPLLALAMSDALPGKPLDGVLPPSVMPWVLAAL